MNQRRCFKAEKARFLSRLGAAFEREFERFSAWLSENTSLEYEITSSNKNIRARNFI